MRECDGSRDLTCETGTAAWALSLLAHGKGKQRRMCSSLIKSAGWAVLCKVCCTGFQTVHIALCSVSAQDVHRRLSESVGHSKMYFSNLSYSMKVIEMGSLDLAVLPSYCTVYRGRSQVPLGTACHGVNCKGLNGVPLGAKAVLLSRGTTSF